MLLNMSNDDSAAGKDIPCVSHVQPLRGHSPDGKGPKGLQAGRYANWLFKPWRLPLFVFSNKTFKAMQVKHVMIFQAIKGVIATLL